MLSTCLRQSKLAIGSTYNRTRNADVSNNSFFMNITMKSLFKFAKETAACTENATREIVRIGIGNIKRTVGILIDITASYSNISSVAYFNSVCRFYKSPNKEYAAIRSVLDICTDSLFSNDEVFSTVAKFDGKEKGKLTRDELLFLEEFILTSTKHGAGKDTMFKQTMDVVCSSLKNCENDVISKIAKCNKTILLKPKEGDVSGNVVNVLSEEYSHYMGRLCNPNKRKNLEMERERVCEENVLTLTKIFMLREAKGKLVGFRSYADMMLGNNSILYTPDLVNTFLKDAAKETFSRYIKELKILRETQKKISPHETRIEVLDVDYLIHKHREISRENWDTISEYFSVSYIVLEVIRIYEELFEIEIRRTELETWNVDVIPFYVKSYGKTLGFLYLDLIEREAKRRQHQCITVFYGCEFPYGKEIQKPHCVISMSFESMDSQIGYEMVVSAAHEIAHALQETRYTPS